jgi:hypothetical protein
MIFSGLKIPAHFQWMMRKFLDSLYLKLYV